MVRITAIDDKILEVEVAEGVVMKTPDLAVYADGGKVPLLGVRPKQEGFVTVSDHVGGAAPVVMKTPIALGVGVFNTVKDQTRGDAPDEDAVQVVETPTIETTKDATVEVTADATPRVPWTDDTVRYGGLRFVSGDYEAKATYEHRSNEPCENGYMALFRHTVIASSLPSLDAAAEACDRHWVAHYEKDNPDGVGRPAERRVEVRG